MNKKFALNTKIIVIILIVFIIVSLISKYNNLVRLNETVKEKWSQVENVYQRRYDLIPNLVATVKGYASHEKETLTQVTKLRSQMGGMLNLSDKIINNPEMFKKFQSIQDNLTSALQRLMVVVERYPDLKANENFLALQDQLEGTENRIAVERKRFNQAVREYNIYTRKFPNNLIAKMLGFKERPYFKAKAAAQEAPKVKFD